MLEKELESLDGVREELQSFYREQDGKFVLHSVLAEELDGLLSALKNERARARQIEKELAETEEQLEAIPNRLKKVKMAEEAFQSQLQEQAEAMTSQLDEKDRMISELESEIVLREQKLTAQQIDNAISAAAVKASVQEGALEDVLARGRQCFRIEDGEIVARNENGELLFGDTGEPLDPEGWIRQLNREAPHLFRNSSGAGTRNESGSTTFTKKVAKMTLTEKADFVSQHGLEAWERKVAREIGNAK